MNRNNEDFLNAYKAYEATAIKVYGSANIYEDDNQCTVTGNKLKLCRTVRNYLSHNGDGNTFVTATTNMADFLRGETTNILKAQLTVEKVLKKQKALSKKDTIQTVITMLSKVKGLVPVVDDTGTYIGSLSPSAFICILAKHKCSMSTSIGSVLTKKDLYFPYVASPDVALSQYDYGDDVVIVTSNAKYKGVVNWNKAVDRDKT